MSDKGTLLKIGSINYGKASLICGISAFGLWFLSILLGLLLPFVLFRNAPSHDWSFTALRIINYVLLLFSLVLAILAVVFSAVSTRQLLPESSKKDRRRPKVGLVLGVVYIALLLIPTFASNIYLHTGGPKRLTAWRSKKITENLQIKYREVDLGVHDDFNQVFMLSSDYGWLVGDNGTVFIYRDKKWKQDSRAANPDSSINSVSILDKNDVWCVGYEDVGQTNINYPEKSLILHYDGKTFRKVETRFTNSLSSIYMVSKARGWACGVFGIMLVYDGNRWEKENVAIDTHLDSLLSINSHEGWAVGAGLLHYANGSWSVVKQNMPSYMHSLIPLDNGSLLVGGTESLVKMKDESLEEIPGFEGRTISSMAKDPRGDILLVGGDASEEKGKIMDFSNGQKAKEEITFPRFFTSISFDSQYHGWITGRGGTLIEFRLLKAR